MGEHRGAQGERAGAGLRPWLAEHGQTLFNIWLFANLLIWIAWQTSKTWSEGRLNYVEVSFAVQNLIMVALILVRSRHRAVDRSVWHQVVAVVAFFSGMAFIGQPSTAGPIASRASDVVTLAANVLGAIVLLNLGRSFGILIALRRVKTGGLYSIVRHPMYGTDILLRVGFLISHTTWLTAVLFVLSTACYVYRAILEERFLGQDPEYEAYKARVRWRFVPFVF